MTKTCCLSEGARQTMLEEIYARYQWQVWDPNCVDVVPTPYASLALAISDAGNSPVTMIVEVNNPADPCENGVYAIEPNGETKKITDPSILYKDWSNNVFANTCTNFPILSTSTTEPMAIDTATGQLGRTQPLTTYQYDYDSWFLSVATNIPPTYNTAQHNHWSNTYTPPSFIVPTAPTWYTYYIVWHLYTIIANQTYYNCSLSHYIDLFVNWVQQSRGSITQLPNEEIFYDGDVNGMIQDLNAGTNTLRIDIDSRKLIGWFATSSWVYTDHSLLMRIKAKILLRKL